MGVVKIRDKTAGPVAARLLDIEAIKLNLKTPYTWSSGWKSPIYCDNRLALSYPDIREFITEELTHAVHEHFPQTECISGVATAGIPQGTLVADRLRLPFSYVRPKPKEHGMGNLIEGKIVPGSRVVLVEDLISTGGSSLKAAQALQDAGFIVLGMVAIFTYGFEESEKNFEKAGIALVCLSDFNHMLQEAILKKFLHEDQLRHISSWRLNPAAWK
jgi:orotate phosphoribosyltransferase